MVYTIDYEKNGTLYVLYDIEIWLNHVRTDGTNDDWQTDLIHSCMSNNIAQYIFDNIHNQNTLDEFKKDAHEIDELRGYLFEHHRNYYYPYKEAKDKFENEFIPEIEKIIYGFAKKWNFIVRK